MSTSDTGLEYSSFSILSAGEKPIKFIGNYFKLEHYLWNIKSNSSFDYYQDRLILYKLAKKIDVANSLKTIYVVDLSKPVLEDSLPDHFICILVEIFLYSALKFKDYKLLNSALKIFDGILDGGRKIEGLDHLENSLGVVINNV